jgi:hypothetical protein
MSSLAFAVEVRRAFPKVTESRPTIATHRVRVWNGLRATEVAISEQIAA